MRHAKSISVWLAALVVIVLAGDRAMSAVLDQVLVRSQFRFSRVYQRNSDAQILVLGDSRGMNSFSAPAMERLTGKRVLNLSYNSMNPRIAEAVLEDYLQSNRAPELVVIEVTCTVVDSNLATELRTYANRSPRLRALYAESHPRAARMGEVFHLLSFNSEFFFRALYYLRHSDQDSIPESTISADLLATPMGPWTPVPIPENLAALDRMVRLLRQRGIIVRLIIAPYLGGEAVQTRYLSDVISNRVHLPVFDYAAQGGLPERFADRVHLNRRGATAFCERLAADGVFRR